MAIRRNWKKGQDTEEEVRESFGTRTMKWSKESGQPIGVLYRDAIMLGKGRVGYALFTSQV